MLLDADGWATRVSSNAVDSSSSQPLSAEALCSAYRLTLRCLSRHSSPANRALNCLASPRCFAGFHVLSTDPKVLQECVAAIIGPGPQLLPEFSADKPTAKAIHIPRRGIRNLGNTCYLNAVLQMLFSVPGVRGEILNACAVERPLRHTVDGESRVSSTHNAADFTAEGGLVDSGLGEVFAEMSLSRDALGANTGPFASFLSLDPHVQQDAQEFFALLLNWLEREGGEAVHAAVRKAFEGTLLYDRACTACGRSFKRAEPFFFLSVPVRSSLEDALGTFLQVEEVHGFVCEECGATTTASSMQYIRTLPDVLIVHLNRFTFDLKTLQRCKVTGTCSFPLEWDLSNLLREWQSRNCAGEEKTSESGPEELSYSLCGVVNHLGDTAVSGHYTYYGKIDGRAGWYHFDDSEVVKLQRFNGARGSSKDAYMLIYQRSAKPSDVVHVDPTNGSTLDGRIADNIVLPPRLLHHVKRLNNELERSHMHWGRRQSELMLFLQRWSDVAGELFGKSPVPHNVTEEEAKKSMEECFALPSSWLELLGSGFLPSDIDLKRFGEKGKKRNRGESGPPASHPSRPKETDESKEDANAKQNFSPNKAAAKDTAAFGESEAAAAAAALRLDGGAECATAEIFSRAAGIKAHTAALLCPHGRLAPWAPFKLVPPAAFAKLVTFMNTSGAARSDGAAGVEWSDAALSKWRLRDNMCDACVHTFATEVLKLKESFDEERTAQAMLYDVDAAASSNAVFVGEHVLDYWKDLIAARALWNDIENRQGLTALCSVQQQCGHTQEQLRTIGPVETMPPLPSAGNLLCPHKLITPLAALRIVPEGLWRYLRQRVLLPACTANRETCNSAAPAQVEEILPHLPVASTPKCAVCIQSTVATTAERHQARMAKMDEAKRFPTIAAAGLHLTAAPSFADAQAQHPNRALWKRHLERHMRDYRREWEKSHEVTIAEQEAHVAALEAKNAKHKEREAQWAAMRSRGRNYRTQTYVQADAKERRSSEVESEISVRLREAREALNAARAAQCPVKRVAYGCVPAWWVVAWRQWYVASDDNPTTTTSTKDYYDCDGGNTRGDTTSNNNDNNNNISNTGCGGLAPPCFDLDDFRCPHGGSLIPASILNPFDSFWESRARAAHFNAHWHRRGRAKEEHHTEEEKEKKITVPSGAGPASSGAWLPPLVIVPMDEFVEIAAAYGRPGMFLPPSADAARELDASAVLLFVERNAERVMEPPTCQMCAAALVESMEEASRRFIGGSVSLKLHLRKSKRQFYDANDVLTDVHHTTTLGELRTAISQLVLEKHKFFLPAEEMEILRGRKALQKTIDNKTKPTRVWNVDASQKSTENEKEDVGSEEVKETEEGEGDEDYCTLAEFGVCDGDVLTVNAIHRVLIAACAEVEPEVWQDVPEEILNPQETSHAFGATRLCGAGGGGKSRTTDAPTEKAQVACDVCTFLNSVALSHCEMCEAPLLPTLS